MRSGRALATVLFPGAVAISLTVPSLLVGALAFDVRRDVELDAADIGASVSGFYLLSLVATRLAMPLLARLSPTAMTRIGLLVSAASMLTAASLGSGIGLVVMVVGAGVANGLATPSANILIAVGVPEHRRGLAFGLRMSAVPGAAAIGALAASVVAHTGIGWRSCFGALALACFALAVAARSAGRPALTSGGSPVRSAGVNGNAALRLLALGGLLAATACSTLSPFLVDGLVAAGAQPGEAALLLAVSAWVGVATRIFVGLVADQFPLPARHLTGATVMLFTAALGMVGLAFGRSTPVLTLATLLTFSLGWAWPGLVHHAAIALHSEQLARAATFMQMGTYTGGLLGPFGFGLLVESGSYPFAWCAAAGLAVIAGLILAAGNRVSRALTVAGKRDSSRGRP